MKKVDRIFVYFAGVLIGMVVVSILMNRKQARHESVVDPWLQHNEAMVEAGAAPLPEGVAEPIQSGSMRDFGFLPSEEAPLQRVWLLDFEKRYPHVRVVEDLRSGELSYMAADQIIIELAEGKDVTELKPMLDELGLRLRMFNRKGKVAVIGVLHKRISAVPDTIAALTPWSELYKSAEPDWILFRD